MVQQLRKSITALVFFLISGALWAQPAKPPSAPLALKQDAPDRYVVVPGDTLWGISGRYTDSPWRWPELWGMNREQIQNPHLIYPGYVILLDRARGRLIRVSWQDQSDKIQSPTVQWEPMQADRGIRPSPLTTIEELCIHIYKSRKKINLVSERQAHRPFVSVAKNG